MPSQAHRYHLTTVWTLAADLVEVDATLADAARFPDWWPEVYLAVELLHLGALIGTGVWRLAQEGAITPRSRLSASCRPFWPRSSPRTTAGR